MYQDKTSMQNFFKNFLKNEGSSAKTIRNYMSDLNDFISFIETTKKTHPTFSFQTVQEINQEDINFYKIYSIEQGKSVATIQRRISSLKMFFKACIQAGFIQELPFLEKAKQAHPLINIWKDQLKGQGKEASIAHDVQDFLDWFQGKNSS